MTLHDGEELLVFDLREGSTAASLAQEFQVHQQLPETEIGGQFRKFPERPRQL